MSFTQLTIRDVPGDDDLREIVAVTKHQQVIAKVNLEDLGFIVTSTEDAEDWKQHAAKDILWEAAYYGIFLHPETILEKLGELLSEVDTWS